MAAQKQGRPLKTISQRIRLGTYSQQRARESLLPRRDYSDYRIRGYTQAALLAAQVADRHAERDYQISM